MTTNQLNSCEQQHLMIGMVNMNNLSNRDIERLYDRYNPNNVKTNDRVSVKLGSIIYEARIVGLELDVKNRKVFANLKLVDTTRRVPIRVDCADCYPRTLTYPGHHNNG